MRVQIRTGAEKGTGRENGSTLERLLMHMELIREIEESGSNSERLFLKQALHSILQVRETKQPFLSEFIGIQGRWTGEGSYRFETDVTKALYNTSGIVHGGVLSYMAETAMGSLLNRLLPKGKITVTSEIKLNFISAVREGKLVTLAELLHLGKRTAVAECKIYNEEGDIAASASASFVILDKPK